MPSVLTKAFNCPTRRTIACRLISIFPFGNCAGPVNLFQTAQSDCIFRQVPKGHYGSGGSRVKQKCVFDSSCHVGGRTELSHVSVCWPRQSPKQLC